MRAKIWLTYVCGCDDVIAVVTSEARRRSTCTMAHDKERVEPEGGIKDNLKMI